MERFHRSKPELLDETEGDLVERLREEISAAVERQMVADVPVGVMLSGGTDWANCATIMSQVAHEPVRSFTVGFAGGLLEK